MAHDVTELKHPPPTGTILSEGRVTLCAPPAHQTLGAFPDDTVRSVLRYFNTLDDVELAIKAVEKVAAKMESFGDAWLV